MHIGNLLRLGDEIQLKGYSIRTNLEKKEKRKNLCCTYNGLFYILYIRTTLFGNIFSTGSKNKNYIFFYFLWSLRASDKCKKLDYLLSQDRKKYVIGFLWVHVKKALDIMVFGYLSLSVNIIIGLIKSLIESLGLDFTYLRTSRKESVKLNISFTTWFRFLRKSFIKV